jgi:hypothetical protein
MSLCLKERRIATRGQSRIAIRKWLQS